MTEHSRRAIAAAFLRLPTVALAVIIGWAAATPASADGDLVVSTRGGTDTRVVISSERGGRQVVEDTDGDGVVQIRPNAGAGPYSIEITAGGVTESAHHPGAQLRRPRA